MFFLWLVSLLCTAGKYLWWYTEEQRRISDNRAQERRTGFNGAERRRFVCLCILTTTVASVLLYSPWSTIAKQNTQTWETSAFFKILLFVRVCSGYVWAHAAHCNNRDAFYWPAALKQGSLCEIIATFGANQHILFMYIESNGNFDCTSC